jgi:GNAT superfamily N-acetyltransferase
MANRLDRRMPAQFSACIMSIAPYRIRAATVGDAATIARHRVLMFRDMGIELGDDAAALESTSRDYFEGAVADGRYRGWMADLDGAVAAGGGLILRELLPRPGHVRGGIEAYVLNIYTEPTHRRRGLARALMHAMLEWTAGRGIARVTLHASDEGRPLYESLGFAATNEMCRPVGCRV